MALTNAWPGVDGQATTTDARKNLAGMVVRDSSGVARAGVFPTSTSALVTARADMNVDIAAHNAVAVQFGGPILLANDGVAQLPAVLVSPVSGTNYYVIYEKQNESTSPGTDASNTRVFGNVLSTTSFAAARGTLPAGAIELATAQIPSGVTATNAIGVTITPTFLYTATEGGTVLTRNQTELDAWTPHQGSRAYKLSDKRIYGRAVTGASPSGVWIPERAIFLARRQSSQTLAVAGWHGIGAAFGSADINDLGTWTPAGGTLQVTQAGIYHVGSNVRLQNASAPMATQITQNSSTPDVGVLVDAFSNATSLSSSGVVVLAAGDVLRLLVYTSVANSIDTTGARGLQLSVELLALT